MEISGKYTEEVTGQEAFIPRAVALLTVLEASREDFSWKVRRTHIKRTINIIEKITAINAPQ